MNAGWPFAEFRRVTDFDLRDGWSAEMNQLVERGWAAHDDQRFSAHPAGIAFCGFGGGTFSAVIRWGESLSSPD